ncbi:hypothetical protein KIN20_001817 [Parelaphostrongylus tenuis]|uniref:Alpha-(1,6)-fucosyltransferase N- and catalytic domain-containing protein n=1 Tax=Parelaphostrongylus tenuis TaxID=148309 RepID=A0AAD5LYY0_PARTN|nr:hypothetical protein KIN20_001817 [Parelaphostrongylus tenuis]
MFSMKSAAIAAVLLWILMLYYLTIQLFGLQEKGYGSEETAMQLNEALQLLKELRKQNAALQQTIDSQKRDHIDDVQLEAYKKRRRNQRVNDEDAENTAHNKELNEATGRRNDLYSVEHEVSRRLVESRIWEMFYYLRVHYSDSSKKGLDKKHVEEQMLSLLATASNMSEVDDAASWRQKSLQSLTESIQRKIYEMQAS